MSRIGLPALGPGRTDRLRTLGAVVPHGTRPGQAYINYVAQPAAGKTVTVKVEDNPAVTFKFVVTVADDWDVKIGISMDDTYTNLMNAWNMTAAPGVGDNQAGGKYKVPNYLDVPDGDRQPWATLDADNDYFNLECSPDGVWGNSVELSWTLAPLTEINLGNSKTFAARGWGSDNTPGKKGDLLIVDDTLYLCVSECGWAQRENPGTYWKKVQLTATL